METLLTTFPRRVQSFPTPIPARQLLRPTAAYDEARLTYLSLAFGLAAEIEAGDETAIRLLRAAAREIAFAREMR